MLCNSRDIISLDKGYINKNIQLAIKTTINLYPNKSLLDMKPLTFQSPMVAIGNTRFNTKNFTFCPLVGQQNISTDKMFKLQIIEFNYYT
jgi:hypothetical protein